MGIGCYKDNRNNVYVRRKKLQSWETNFGTQGYVGMNKKRGRPKKKWMNLLKEDIVMVGAKEEDEAD